jgi:branched-chain amino acid transport system permease protein
MPSSVPARGAILIAVAVLASLLAGKGYASSLIVWIAGAAVLASSLRFVTLIGELNFAVAAFLGLGAYAAGAATTLWGWPFLAALVAGGALAAVVSVAFGYVTLRVKGPYFLLIGFAFTEVMRIAYSRSAWLGGNSGMVGVFPPVALAPWFNPLVVCVSGLLILGLAMVEHSHLGRVFTAIRDNENVVRSVGIDVHRMKLLCFSLSSLVAGIAGALQAFTNNVISPQDFGFMQSTFALAFLKVGGEAHPLGPVAGAIVLVLLASVAQNFGASEQIFYGGAIVVAVLFMPGGLTGLVAQGRGRRRAPGRAAPSASAP